ncbi:MAG TPA: hypothetical protein VLM85_01850 [Polyangiaceae bacterium]|nr:hypothetical protein [Polyangiaceae bacterium]
MFDIDLAERETQTAKAPLSQGPSSAGCVVQSGCARAIRALEHAVFVEFALELVALKSITPDALLRRWSADASCP